MLTAFILSKIRSWIVYRRTVLELERLSDRELSDLGIRRLDIRAIARTAAR